MQNLKQGNICPAFLKCWWGMGQRSMLLVLVLLLLGCSTKAQSNCVTQGMQGTKKIGNPYYIQGVKYYPISSSDGFTETGVASWYGPGFHGKKTANGETYNQKAMTAAHKTLPIPTMLRVENLENGKEVIVRVNDRGPYSKGRIIDLSESAARQIAMVDKGTARVRVTALSEDANCYVSNGREVNLDSGDYALQVGAFADINNAQRMADKLGRKATIKSSNGLHKVWLSGFKSRHEAINASYKYDGSFVVRTN